MISNDIKYRVEDGNQIYINMNDLLEIIMMSEEDLGLKGRLDAKNAMEELEQGLLFFGIDVLRQETYDTIDEISHLL